MRTVVVAGLLLATLSGCISETVGPTEVVLPTRESTQDQAESSGSAGGSRPPVRPVVVPVVANRAPALTLEAEAVSGAAPFAAAFTVDGNDADRDALRWTLDVDSDGVAEAQGTGSLLPFTFEHTYDRAGAFLATATLSDGRASDSTTLEMDSLPSSGGSRQPQAGTAPNQRPRAFLTASALQGHSPLSVTFDVRGFDYDAGESLTWTLDTNGDGNADASGSTLPATVTRQFATGTHPVTLRISDGRLTGSASLQVVATDPPLPDPDPEPLTVHVLELLANCAAQCSGCEYPLCAASATGIVPVPGASGCAGFQASNMGLECVWATLPAAAAGAPFLVESAAGDPEVQFLTSCDPTTATSVQVFVNAGPESGLIPAGARCLVAWEWELQSAPPVEVTISYALDTEAICPTSTAPGVVALRTPEGLVYVTIGDITTASLWVYEESNGLAGLQRDDDTVPTDCPIPDTVVL